MDVYIYIYIYILVLLRYIESYRYHDFFRNIETYRYHDFSKKVLSIFVNFFYVCNKELAILEQFSDLLSFLHALVDLMCKGMCAHAQWHVCETCEW